MTVSVEPLDPGSGVPRGFLELPRRVYRGDPHYCPPSRDSLIRSLLREEFRASQRAFLALDGGRPVARAVARLSPALRDPGGRPYGMLGFFEALDRPAAVAALFERAVGWLRGEGAGPIVGPMNGDTWHSYRLNAGPFDGRPFLMEPYNPPYYPGLWRRHGFEVLERYCSKRVDGLEGVAAALAPKHERAAALGYRFVTLEMDRFESELGRLYELSCRIFAGNFLYTEISRRGFLDLYRGSRPLLDPRLVLFALAPDGSDAGFLFAFPDRFRAVAAMKGGTGPWARLRFLAARRRPEAVNLKSLGVVPEHRRSGLGAALMHLAYKTAHDLGYVRANLCLILDGNPSERLEAGLGRITRRYELYRLGGGAAS